MKIQRLMALSALLMMSLTFIGCQQPKKVKQSEDFFKELKTYEATAEVSFLKDTQPNKLSMKQRAKISGEFEMEYLEPLHLKGTKIAYDGTKIIEMYENGQQQIEEKPGVAQEEILLTSFAKRFLIGKEVKKQETILEGRKMITYEMPIEGQYKYLAKEKVWLDMENLKPARLEIYDIEGNISIQVIYKEFKYNG